MPVGARRRRRRRADHLAGRVARRAARASREPRRCHHVGRPPPRRDAPTHADGPADARHQHPAVDHGSTTPATEVEPRRAEADAVAEPGRSTLRDVEVVVLNQTSRGGLAGSVAEELRDKGWTVPAVGNFRGIVPATTVYYPAGARRPRRGRAASLPHRAAHPAAVRQPVDDPADRGRHRLLPGLSVARRPSRCPEPSTEAGRAGSPPCSPTRPTP